MKVALFTTCLVDAMAGDVGAATVRLLERLGVELEVPSAQTCCGQMHVNTGYPRQAIPLVRNHVRAFAGYDAVVTPSGSCAAAVRHQHQAIAKLADDGELVQRVAELAPRTYELSEFLIDVLGAEDVGAYFPHRVTFHPTCHSLRVLQVGARPMALLRAVEGLDLVELPDAETCCGFGGTFALKNAAVSSAMLADKCAGITRTGADVCTAADASCLLHIAGGLSRRRDKAQAVHLAQVLASTREEPWSA